MSTTLDKMTATELVAEEKSLVSALQMGAMGIGNANLSTIARHKAVVSELDARCAKAGISLINRDGIPQFKYCVWVNREDDVWLIISATEQHALEGYLITKGGKG